MMLLRASKAKAGKDLFRSLGDNGMLLVCHQCRLYMYSLGPHLRSTHTFEHELNYSTVSVAAKQILQS